jgi:hypothetical protein
MDNKNQKSRFGMENKTKFEIGIELVILLASIGVGIYFYKKKH